MSKIYNSLILFLILSIEISLINCKSGGSIRTNKAKTKTSSGGKSSKSDPIKVYDDSTEILSDNNDTDDMAYTLPDEQLLIQELLTNYDVAARPVFNASHPVIVKFNLALIQIIDMDERNQILTTNVWIEHEWFDERLKWNSSNYNHLDKIRLPSDRIWLPDVILYNSADEYAQEYMNIKAMVKPDGEIFWSPPVKLSYFPFDDQVILQNTACIFKFGSWSYSGLQLDLVNRSIEVEMSNYVESGEWELRAIWAERNLVYYPCCPNEPYPDITFYIFIRRRVFYYLNNVILPVIWLSILSLLVFWLPPGSGDKISLGITVLLSFSMFMLLIAENVPTTSDSVPIVGIYLTIIMALSSMSIILTVVVLRLHHTDQFVPAVPRRLYDFFTRKIARVIGLSKTVKLYEANMEKSDFKLYKENSFAHSYNQPIMTSSLLQPMRDEFLSFDRADFDNINEYSKLSSIKETKSICSSCRRKYMSHSLLENVDANTKDAMRNNIQNEWKLLALIVDRFLFWIFSILTFFSTVMLLVIVPVFIRSDDFIKPK